MKRARVAAVIGVLVAAASIGGVALATHGQGDDRPGWGYGDHHHHHTGPPGHSVNPGHGHDGDNDGD